MPLVSFDNPWKLQKTRGFLMFPRGIKRDQWYGMDYKIRNLLYSKLESKLVKYEIKYWIKFFPFIYFMILIRDFTMIHKNIYFQLLCFLCLNLNPKVGSPKYMHLNTKKGYYRLDQYRLFQFTFFILGPLHFDEILLFECSEKHLWSVLSYHSENMKTY